MLEFLAQYGPAIIAGIISIGSLAGAIYNIIKCFRLGKKIDTTSGSLEKNMEITREGIVEAFKSAKLPSEIKISISTKVEDILGKVRDTVITEFKKNEATRNEAILLILKILSFSQAANKLTEDEKNKINDLLKSITEEDATIEI